MKSKANIEILTDNEIKSGKMYYITLVHIKSLVKNLVNYEWNTYIDKEKIDTICNNDEISDTKKQLVKTLMSGMVPVLCRIDDKEKTIQHIVRIKSDKDAINQYLAESISTMTEFRLALLNLQGMVDKDYQDYDITVDDDNLFKHLAVEWLYHNFMNTINSSQPEHKDYDYWFDSLIKEFFMDCLWEEDAPEMAIEYASDIEDLRKYFFELLYNYHPKLRLLEDCFNLESRLWLYDEWSHTLQYYTQKLYDEIIVLWDSITSEDKKTIIAQENNSSSSDNDSNNTDTHSDMSFIEKKRNELDKLILDFFENLGEQNLLYNTMKTADVILGIQNQFDDMYLDPMWFTDELVEEWNSTDLLENLVLENSCQYVFDEFYKILGEDPKFERTVITKDNFWNLVNSFVDHMNDDRYFDEISKEELHYLMNIFDNNLIQDIYKTGGLNLWDKFFDILKNK